MPTPLIHVGFPKAMSSWLQKFLFVEKNGFSTIMGPMECQIEIINPSPFKFSPIGIAQRIERFSASQDSRLPVITSESLSGNMYAGGYDAKQIADRLHEAVPNARLLLVIREQKSLIRSLYKSWISWGIPNSIQEILDPLSPSLSPRFNWDYLEFDQRILYYQDQFGADNVLVLPYELFGRNPLEFLSRIRHFCGMPAQGEAGLSGLPVRRKVNRGQSLAWLYLLRLQNRHWYKTPFNASGIIPLTDERLMRRIAKAKRNPLPRFTEHWFEARFHAEVLARTAGRYAASNRRVEALTGLDLGQYGYD